MKLKELINNETFLSEYGDYEIVGDSYTTVRQNDKSQLVFDIQKPNPKTVWDLAEGDKHYWTGYDGGVEGGDSIWTNSYSDKNAREIGNVFLTKKETEQDIERRKVETLLIKHGGRRWLSHTVPNYYLVVNGFNELYFTSILSSQYPQGIIYFNSGSDVQNAINEIGKERIIKALFEVR